ncbi:hypothetical protein [Advenella kashmirensis]|uniref:hypothetical protein n=1 Tax=Advenella kashmirensis TaxID=310575 RepID=UPI001EE68230|nr:hypothetical protein [Advenella kashmirensis]
MANIDSNGSRVSLLRRLVYASMIGAVLFGGGYAVDKSGGIAYIYEAIGGRVDAEAPQAIYSREQMQADRKSYKAGLVGERPQMPVGANGFYQPPSEDAIPDSPYGDAVRRGRAIFTDTKINVQDHVGNEMACVNCHLDAGRRENSAPMWGAYGATLRTGVKPNR